MGTGMSEEGGREMTEPTIPDLSAYSSPVLETKGHKPHLILWAYLEVWLINGYRSSLDFASLF